MASKVSGPFTLSNGQNQDHAIVHVRHEQIQVIGLEQTAHLKKL